MPTEPTTPTSHTARLADDGWWLGFFIVVTASLFVGDGWAGCHTEAEKCERWADGGPLDPVSADERRARDAYCASAPEAE